MGWKSLTFQRELNLLIPLIRKAAQATERIREEGIRFLEKEDGSPLTQADIVSQAILLSGLKEHFPEDAIAAEEEVESLDPEIRRASCRVLEDFGLRDCGNRLDEWIGFRGGRSSHRLWMVDPIDGTKGFRKGLCYAVAVGLCVDGVPRFGLLAAPAFPTADGRGTSSVVAFAAFGEGAWRIDREGESPRRIHVSDRSRINRLRLVGSRAHADEDVVSYFMKETGIETVLPMDSQAKYLMVATGQAEVYLRAARPGFGIGYVWDHCAGEIILREAGGDVSDFGGLPLRYLGHGFPKIDDVAGMLASNGICHEALLGRLENVRA